MSGDGLPAVDSEAPWYAEGLRFHCTACGVCCTGVPGHVWVEEAEIDAMARVRGVTARQFRRRYVRRIGRRLSLRERKNGDCVMLSNKRCSVYAAKPVRCSTYPFWPDVLESRAEWEDTATRCEGIGQGEPYARAEIERIASGDPAPLLARQAAAELRDGKVGGRASGETAWEAALEDLEALYAELDEELPRFRFTCSASGRCCDFDTHGHRLYVTTLEAEYFFRHAPAARSNANDRHCPAWGADRLCNARASRMLGCRTYFCGPYPNGLPEDLYEGFHRRIKALHDRHGIPFAYRDIVDWSRERRPVG